MATASPGHPSSSKTQQNRCRLFRLQMLIIDGGLQILRNILDTKLQNVSLSSFLQQERSTITKLKSRGIITQVQYDLLFASGGNGPATTDLDITLIICLLRNIKTFGLNKNFQWNSIPAQGDTSVEADISRLKVYRNELSHISSTSGITLNVFTTKWTEIEQVLLRLNTTVSPIPDLQTMIDDFKVNPLDPQAERRVQKAIDSWHKLETGVEAELKLLKMEDEKIKCTLKLQDQITRKHTQSIGDLNKKTCEHDKQIHDHDKQIHDHAKQIQDLKVKEETRKDDKAETESKYEESKQSYIDTSSDEKVIQMTREMTAPGNTTLIYNDTYSDVNAIQMTRELTAPGNTTLIHVNNVRELLDEYILPNNKDIQSINKYCGRQSKIMQSLCGKICKVINRNVYNDTATDIWPAWDPARDEIVFIVESTKVSKIRSSSCHFDIEIIEYHRNCSAFEKESYMVMAKEQELLTNQTYDDMSRMQSLQKIISTYSKELMDKHRNITAIFPSIVKSVGYFNSVNHRFIEALCISIRVEKKVSGLIPLEEEPIATYLDKFPTDVIKGDICFLGDRPNDFHENIKIGSAIHAGLVTDKGEMLGGTMGCFVKHRIFGMCCITSAHIVLSQAEIQEVLKDGYREYDNNSSKPVYQPISIRFSQFGQVVAAACNEGQSATPGVEVALIKILCRHPTSGSFPLTDSNTRHTFTFNSGNVADATLVRPLTEVFKFGIQSGPTFGLLGIPGVSVRYREGLRLENQLVVMPKKDAPFAQNGDSGSSAFIGMSCPGTEAVIGLVSGGFDSGQVLVTPIYAALKAVQCPPYLHRFEDADSGFNEGSDSMDCS